MTRILFGNGMIRQPGVVAAELGFQRTLRKALSVVSNVADELAAAKLIAPPDTLYTYAVTAPR